MKIGQTVHMRFYSPARGVEYCRPAIVTEVHKDERLDLVVFGMGPHGTEEWDSVRMDARISPATWHQEGNHCGTEERDAPAMDD